MDSERRTAIRRRLVLVSWIVVLPILLILYLNQHLLSRNLVLIFIGLSVAAPVLIRIYFTRLDAASRGLRSGKLLCPRCEYQLPETTDDTVTCPECGYLDTVRNIRLVWRMRGIPDRG